MQKLKDFSRLCKEKLAYFPGLWYDTISSLIQEAAEYGRSSDHFGAVLLLFSIAIILIVLLQEGHQKNVGVVTGGADTFFSKNKARSIDAFLARWTKVISVGFFAMVIIINIIMYFSA